MVKEKFMKKQPEMTAATKQRLVDAFWTLYEKKRIDQIRVKEITDLAQLHRGTFYEYFNDIYDLAAQEETEIMQQLEETMAVKQQNKESNNDLRNIAEFYLKNGRRLNLLIASGSNSDFINRFKDSLFPLFQSVNQTADSERSSIVYEFGINGLLMAFHKWYEFENRMPIDDLLKLLQSIIGTGIPDTLKSL